MFRRLFPVFRFRSCAMQRRSGVLLHEVPFLSLAQPISRSGKVKDQKGGRSRHSAAKPQPKRIKDGGSKRRSCSLANVRGEEKRQGTAALQNLAEASWLRGARSRLGVRLSSAAFARTAQRDRTLPSHPACTVELRFETFGNFVAACQQFRLLQCGGIQRWQNH